MNGHIGRAVVLEGVEWTIWSEHPRPQCYWAFRTEQGGGAPCTRSSPTGPRHGEVTGHGGTPPTR